ncbi:MAG: siphovirus Gp157 family protein [Rhodomicrobium sp.]
MSALTIVTSTEAASATSSLTLAAMTEELACLLDTAEMVDEGSADRAELDSLIAQFQAALPDKVDRVHYALAFLESQEQLATVEIKRLQARRDRIGRDVERLEQYCCRVIEKLPEPKRGPRKLEGRTVTLAIRPSDEVIITDEVSIPVAYKTAVIELPASAWEHIVTLCPEAPTLLGKQDLKVRKADVKKALKSGEDVPGADLKFNNNLRRS